ncbi:TPA: hypothetical protein MI737_05700 [Klebsiella pneumoniae]|uniref:hypothetical protein n=1 Tax=Klebsiella pneumoniae TaxID=573 RepID=UPI00236C1FE6|nr:hypothetical protein [Klebsiella pneumoniae]ELA2040218.1 hypothetical protein [Klebsiella pneumoniae]WLY15606.1 hypothetical protein RA188_18855 [Klebsiella pneumoniae]HBY2032073.1 hypothetical protein [Klebsiella pneumoniae]HBY7809032.1 hypothetical protein [Klebsiella pneumoniae]HDK7013474.1 hypothetical protein [Klebsiella pneumoniae]
MTDITELAQREKFEAWAEERCALPWGYLKNRRTNTGYFSKHDYTSLWAAWKAAGAELVEALEKAQHEARVDWEAAASLNVENQELKRRIAELESRTVKLPRPGFITISGERMAVYLKGDVDAAMLASGIEEAE